MPTITNCIFHLYDYAWCIQNLKFVSGRGKFLVGCMQMYKSLCLSVGRYVGFYVASDIVHMSLLLPLPNRWINALTSTGLSRNLQVGKSSYFTMTAGRQTQRFPGIFSFSVIPATLLIFFVPEDSSQGNMNLNLFSYQVLQLYMSVYPSVCVGPYI